MVRKASFVITLVHRVQAHPVDLVIDRFHRSVFAEIDDEAAPARLQYAAHFLQGANGLAEIFEGRAAQQEVERVISEGHARRIALPEVHVDARFGGLLARDFDEGVADVEAGDGVVAKFRQLDAEIARAGGNFKHLLATRELGRDLPRELDEFIQRSCRCLWCTISRPCLPCRDLYGFG